MIIALSNCNKENKTSANLLASKTWKIGVEDLNPSNGPTETYSFNIVRNCDKDDFLNFGLDSILIINRNENKCDQNEIQTETLTYSLDRTTGEFIIDGIKYTLVEETYSQVKYYRTVPKGSNLTHRIYFLLQ